MDKIDMREWVSSLEEVVDNKLIKWLKASKIENGASVLMSWQFEQTYFHLYVFWEDGKEAVILNYLGPWDGCNYRCSGLNNKTFNRIMDRVGNLAQIVMTPPIDSTG